MGLEPNGCGVTTGCGCLGLIAALIVGGIAVLAGLPLIKVVAIVAIVIGLFALIGAGIDFLVAVL